MTLTFKVAKLQEAAKAIVKQHEDARAQYAKDLEAYRLDFASRWNSDRRQRGFKNLRDYLTTCLKKGVPPRHSEALEVYGYDNLYFYSEPNPNSSTLPTPPGYNNQRIDTTRAMVAFLDAYEGDTISAAQLKVVGFDDLASLYRAAVGS